VDILEKEFPKAIGGDMEGASLSSVCERKKIEWIVIKGVCDWGKGKGKGNNHQNKAAYSANNLTYHVFSKPDSFTDVSKLESYESFTESIDFNAKKWTPLWALNRLRSNVLSAMISDLKLYEMTGLEEEVLFALQNDIDHLVNIFMAIPDLLLNSNKLESYLTRFKEEFSRWGSAEGSTKQAGIQRESSLNKLSKLREKIARVVRRSSFKLGTGLSDEIIPPPNDCYEESVTNYSSFFLSLQR
jgi:hypothetical protein